MELVLIYAKQDLVLRALHNLRREIMSTLDDLAAQVSRSTSVSESAVTLLKGLKAKLDAAGTDPVKLAELSAALSTETDKLAAAVTENTPAA